MHVESVDLVSRSKSLGHFSCCCCTLDYFFYESYICVDFAFGSKRPVLFDEDAAAWPTSFSGPSV